MENEFLNKAKERAAAIVAKAERELAIAEMVPQTPCAPMIVQQAKCVWLVYKPATFGDILTIFDAFAPVPFFVAKEKGWAASTSRAEKEGAETLVSEGFAWCSFTHYNDLRPSFSFRMMSTLTDGTPCEVHVDFEGAYYAKGPWHTSLATRFVCENYHLNRREENLRYTRTAPAFLSLTAYTWFSGTGRDNGSGLCGNGAFMTRDRLARSIDTLAT
jgi:hypothetical protein